MKYFMEVFTTPHARRWPRTLMVFLFVAILFPCSARGQWVDMNVLQNSGFENDAQGLPIYWQGDYNEGNWNPPGPYEGWRFYYPGSTSHSTIYQDVDLTAVSPHYGALDPQRLETGGYYADFGGYQASYPEAWPSELDWGQIGLFANSGDGEWSPVGNLGLHADLSWKPVEGRVRIPFWTNQLRYQFDAFRRDVSLFGNNDAYLDSTFLKIGEYDIWTWGGPSEFAVNDSLTIEGPLNIVYPIIWETPENPMGLRVAGPVVLTTTGLVSVESKGLLLGEAGSIIVSEGSWIAQGPVDIGSTKINSIGEINIDGGGWTTQQEVRVGAEGIGMVNLRGGIWQAEGLVRVGDNGLGQVNIYGGSWAVNGASNPGGIAVVLGLKGSGSVNIDGGAWGTDGIVLMGAAPGGSGEVLVNNGSWTAYGGIDVGVLSGDGELTIGAEGTLGLHDATLRIGERGNLLLQGGLIYGTGEINSDRSDYWLDLGSVDAPSKIVGSSASDRLVINANVCGSGILGNLELIGDLSVGNSVGQVTLGSVLIEGRLVLEILGDTLEEYDRVILDEGTDLSACLIDIDFVDFIPDDADVFDLFDPLDQTDIATILGNSTIDTPIDWQLDLTTGQMIHVPEPTSIVLLAAFSLGIFRRRRGIT